jgi:hypothetical protein
MSGINRRQAIALVAGSIGGTVLVTSGGSSTASAASVDYGSFSVKDTSTVTDGKEVTDVTLSATAQWSYDTNQSVTGHVVELLAGDHSKQSVIESVETTDIGQTGSGETDLSGSILDTYHWDVSDFNPTQGNTRTINMFGGVRFKLMDGETVVAEAKQTDNAYIEVSNEKLTASAEVGGTGEVSISMG